MVSFGLSNIRNIQIVQCAQINAELLLGDYSEIDSALSNLVFSAIQYTPAGGSISSTWQRCDEGARFAVSDSGVGIEAEHIAHLTERFYRVDKARSRQLGGTGLGLAIVKHVLMRHDSTLQVISPHISRRRSPLRGK
jgi:two-component system phosphate regulon sensor histidine kinase PhoR